MRTCEGKTYLCSGTVHIGKIAHSLDIIRSRIGGFGAVLGRIHDGLRATLITSVALRLSALLGVLPVPYAETPIRTGVDELRFLSRDARHVTASRIEVCRLVVAVATEECRLALRAGIQLGVLDPLRASLIRLGCTAVRTGEKISSRTTSVILAFSISLCLPREALYVIGPRIWIRWPIADIVADRARSTPVAGVQPRLFDSFSALQVPARNTRSDTRGRTSRRRSSLSSSNSRRAIRISYSPVVSRSDRAAARH